jgi:hypothetical protein
MLSLNRLVICLEDIPCECDVLLKTNKVAGRPEYLCTLSYIPLHRHRGGLFAARQVLRTKDNS